MLLGCILSSVFFRLSQLSQSPFMQYMGLCVFSLPITLAMIARIRVLYLYNHQIGSMNHFQLFRVRSWNNDMCCGSFYVLTGPGRAYIKRWAKVGLWRTALELTTFRGTSPRIPVVIRTYVPSFKPRPFCWYNRVQLQTLAFVKQRHTVSDSFVVAITQWSFWAWARLMRDAVTM